MPPVPNVALDSSPEDDILQDFNQEYNGQWTVINLSSLESIPFSDFSHSPYGQESNYLDTHSVLSPSSSVRPTASMQHGVRASNSTPIVSSRRSGANRPPLSTSPEPTVTSRLTPAPAPLPQADRGSRQVLETLVRRELAKQWGDSDAGGPYPNSNADSAAALSSTTPRHGNVTPLSSMALRAVRRDEPHPETSTTQKEEEQQHRQQQPERDIASPTVAQSMRELTNARRIPARLTTPPGHDSVLSDHDPSAASASAGTWPALRSSYPIGSGRQAAQQLSASGASMPTLSSGVDRQEQQLTSFRPFPSQRGPQQDGTGEKSAAAGRPAQTTDSPPKRAVAHQPRRASRRDSDSIPSVGAATAAPSPPAPRNGFARRFAPALLPPSNNNGAMEGTDELAASSSASGQRRRQRSRSDERRHRPLQPPLPPVPASAETVTPPTPSAKEQAATASQEHLIAFVEAVSDPEVLHVIYDYISETKGPQYREAACICLELLQRKEKLLRTRGGSATRRVKNCHRIARALLPGDDDDDDDDKAKMNGDEEGVTDEFGDLNFIDTPYPESQSRFQLGEPTVTGTISSVFKEGMLFKIKDIKGDYYFYNDTLNQVMMIRTQCTLLGDENINDRAMLTPVEGMPGVTEITIAVLPEETNFFMGHCKRLPRIMAKAVVTPDNFASPSVTKFMTSMNAEINKVRAALGQWSKATDQKAYLKCCLKNRLRFTDLDFRPCALSLYRPQSDYVKIPALTWRRPEEYLALSEVAETRLFRGEISCHLVKQGELNDHTVVAAIAAIAQFPHHVMWTFRHPVSGEHGKRERALGCYRVTLLQSGWWTTTVVDDYVPASVKGALFAQCPADPRRLWVPLLEKAYAKVVGSYSALCLCDVLDVLHDFTGFPVRRLEVPWLLAQAQPTESPARHLFHYLRRCTLRGYLVLVYTPAASDQQAAESLDLSRKRSARMVPVDGVVPQFLPGHVYFLSDAAYYKELDLRMVRLKNPWTWEAAQPAATATVQKRWRYTGWYEKPDQSFTSTMLAQSELLLGVGSSSSGASVSQAGTATTEEEERKGMTWLEWGEALTTFAGGGVCYSVWRHSHYRVRNSFGTGYPDFVLELTPVKKRVDVLLTITVEGTCEALAEDGSVVVAARHSPGSSRKAGCCTAPAPSVRPCGVTLTVARRAKPPRSGSNGPQGAEEVCAMACDDIECIAGKTTFVRAKCVSLKVTLEPSSAPYHVIPQLDPEDAHALRSRGESQLPFVLGILASEPVGAGELGVHFKRIPRASIVYCADTKYFTLRPEDCGPFTATYQYPCDSGVETLQGTSIEPLEQ